MNRWQVAILIGLIIAVVFPGLPILGFFLRESRPSWTFGTWIIVLIPNLILLLLVGSLAAGMYMLSSRRGRK